MKKKLTAMIICVLMIISILPAVSFAGDTDSIVILYENDVHCEIDGYSKIAAMKNELSETNDYVGVVSSGDFIQGATVGVISKGEYIVELMNIVGYDAVALGNHEFDYQIPKLVELAGKMDTKPVCCNFYKIGEDKSYFAPYTIVSYGDTDIAYIGITTPDTLTCSSPHQFLNEDGSYAYSFYENELPLLVQKSINEAKAEGAEYIILLSHLGTEYVKEVWSAQAIVSQTEGIDVVLDAHAHAIVENMILTDKGGNEVVVSSTGTKFQYIGKLTITDGDIKTELIPTETYEKRDEKVDAYFEKIDNESGALMERKVGESLVDLWTVDENGRRIIRDHETNLGNLCADAYRIVMGADIGYVNGGGIRDNLMSGEVTFSDILSVFPFNNLSCVVSVEGQVIKDMLEVSLYYYPVEGGSFPHISGLKFDVNTSMPSYVVLDDREVFIKVDGEYRVENIRVLDSETGEYLPIDLEKKYTVASHSYMLLEQGGGMSMFKDAEVIKNDGMLDVEMLEIYISENLGGVIGEQYAQCDHRINFVDGKAPTQNESADSEIAPVVPSEDGTNVPETIVYTVKWGDTLWALSRAFGCSIDDIVALNSDLIKDPNLIYVGWELTIEQK